MMENFSFVPICNGSLKSSNEVSMATIESLQKIIASNQWCTLRELMQMVTDEGRQLSEKTELESVVMNMTLRILKIIREEYHSNKGNLQEDMQDSLQSLMLSDADDEDFGKPSKHLQKGIIEVSSEYLDELELSLENISSQAVEHIHSNEVILTAGKSSTVKEFLIRASRLRKFQVIVVECAPFFQGHEMAVELARNNIDTTVITDSAVFAVMSRVNKVIIGTCSILADGSLKAISGSHTVALAAKHHSVPLIVCAGLFKLTPQYVCSYQLDNFNKFVSPSNILDYGDAATTRTQVYCPLFDYVPASLVTLIITNNGGHSPSYLYRLVSELYHPNDLATL